MQINSMKLLTLPHLKTGKLYRLAPSEVADFYEESRSQFALPIKDKLRLFGTVLLQLFGPDGALKTAFIGHNLVVDTGRAAVIDRLQAASPAVHDYVAVGTGTNAAAAGDTTLQTETGTRVQGTLSQPTAYTDRVVSTFAAGNATGALTEVGRLNASSTGNLFNRIVFSVVNKGASDSLQATYDVTIS
jgi:hypothetical protein